MITQVEHVSVLRRRRRLKISTPATSQLLLAVFQTLAYFRMILHCTTLLQRQQLKRIHLIGGEETLALSNVYPFLQRNIFASQQPV
jgi:hypothetical protein